MCRREITHTLSPSVGSIHPRSCCNCAAAGSATAGECAVAALSVELQADEPRLGLDGARSGSDGVRGQGGASTATRFAARAQFGGDASESLTAHRSMF